MGSETEAVIQRIREAFAPNVFPGPFAIVGKAGGCEPAEECGPFGDYPEWWAIPSAFLDQHYSALSFFSEAGFRYFLPAFLLADLRGELQTADPAFHLTHGFHDWSIDLERGGRTFTIRNGRSRLVNPRGFGAMTTEDYARWRLSVFCREESGALVAFLENRQEHDDLSREGIRAALELFWYARAREAPTRAALDAHLREEQEYLAALGTPPATGAAG